MHATTGSVYVYTRARTRCRPPLYIYIYIFHRVSELHVVNAPEEPEKSNFYGEKKNMGVSDTNSGGRLPCKINWNMFAKPAVDRKKKNNNNKPYFTCMHLIIETPKNKNQSTAPRPYERVR